MKKFKFTIQGNDYEVEIKKFEDGLAKLEVNGTAYNVELQEEERTSGVGLSPQATRFLQLNRLQIARG